MSHGRPVIPAPHTRFRHPFLVLEENRFAYHALRLLLRPQKHPAVVFIYGPSGTGKTHLLIDFVRQMARQAPSRQTLTVTGSEFAREFSQAAHAGTVADFQHRYRQLDLLILENLHELRRSPQTLLQLLVLMDELSHRGGHVVTTSLCSAAELSFLPARLANRCRGGLCAPLTHLSQTSRRLLLEHFASTHQIPMTAAAIALLAERLPGSPASMLDAMGRIDALARRCRRSIDEAFAAEFLANDRAVRPTTLPAIVRTVARHFGVRVADLRSQKRHHCIARARHIAIYLARQLTDETTVSISRYFGQKSHASTAYAAARIEGCAASDRSLRQTLARLRQSLLEQS